jgi:hypothetical protein
MTAAHATSTLGICESRALAALHGGRFATYPTANGNLEDRQSAQDGDPHGLFTAALLATWNRGAFTGDHDTFLQSIRAQRPTSGSPKPTARLVCAAPATPSSEPQLDHIDATDYRPRPWRHATGQ